MSALVIQCSDDPVSINPIEGVWITTDNKYAGEYMDISSNKLVMGVEGKDSYTYTITEVESEKGHMFNSIFYSIYANDESGQLNKFTFLYKPDDGGILMNKSTQDVLWKRSQ